MFYFADIVKTGKIPFTLLFGAIYCLFVAIFFVISIPVYIYRIFIIFLAQHFRQDLGEILKGQCAVFANDFIAEITPRSNVVISFIFEGQLTLAELRKNVQNNWINEIGKQKLERFQQYPVRWLGFTFWKNSSNTFCLEDHVYRYSEKPSQVTDAELIEITEVLLNKRLPRNQSPWELILIEDYENSYIENSSNNNQVHSMVLLKYHHCISDGEGMAVPVEGLFGQRRINKTLMRSQNTAAAGGKVKQAVLLPFNLISLFSHAFRTDLLRVPDAKKNGHQVNAKSGRISIQLIKNIKNAFGVCFASVLLSSVSSALSKMLRATGKGGENRSSLCFTVLSTRKGATKEKVLSNQLTGAWFNLPTCDYPCPVERLQHVNNSMSKSKTSWMPICAQYFSLLVGANSYKFNAFVAKNRMFGIGLSNFVGLPEGLAIGKAKLIHAYAIAGGHQGDTGIVIMVAGLGQWMEVTISAEQSLLTRTQAEQFLGYFVEEIENLAAKALC